MNSLDKLIQITKNFNKELDKNAKNKKINIIAQNGKDGYNYCLNEELKETNEEKKDTPTHYENGLDYDLIDVINDYNVNFCRGNVIKYVVRAGKKKDEMQDLLKAKDYLEREIERIRINNNN